MDMSEEYKANRKKPKEEAEIQRYDAFFEVLNNLPDMLDEEVLKFRGVEADDILANLVMKYENDSKYDHIWVVSSDRDLHQLISEKTSILGVNAIQPHASSKYQIHAHVATTECFTTVSSETA